MKFGARVVIAALVVLSGSIFAFGQTSSVDPTFNAVPSLPLTSGLSHLVQPDGKVIVYGSKTVIDGVATAEIARLNSDGSRDQSFSYCSCALTEVTGAEPLPDGKIVVAGRDFVGGRIIRLNADGSVDPTFVVFTPGGPSFGVKYFVEAVQPDGKILVTRRTSGPTTNVTFSVYRYNTNATQDSTFAPFTVTSGSGFDSTTRIVLLSDGRFYIASTITGGGFTTSTLNRRNADGSIDSTWQSPGFSGEPGFPQNVRIYDLAVATDGGVLVVGNFMRVNGVEKTNFVKLLPAGNVDLAFPVPSTSATRVYSLPDGKILYATASSISRLNSDGTPDGTFTMDPVVEGVRSEFDVDSSQRIILFAQMAVGIRLIRLLPNGALDGTFQTSIAKYGQVHATAVQADGKVLVAGVFSHMGGVPRSSFARVNSDGSLDPTFDAHSSFDQPPEKLLVQPDGKILALGPFTSYDTVTVPGLVRINADGTRDATFNPTVSSRPLGTALEANGQILISGNFNQVNGASRTGLARLNADGTLDTTFNPLIGNPSITAVIAQADGKIVIGGNFSGVNGFSRFNLARLLNDGSTDQSFVASGVSGGNIILVRQPDSKYLLAYPFTIVRYNADGSGDSGFVAPIFAGGDAWIRAIALQPDGGIIVGGGFETVGSAFRKNLARLLPNGAFDILFLQGGTDGRVRTLSQYSPTKVIVGGEFTSINNVTKAGIARLDVNTARAATPFDFDGDGRADVTVYRPSTSVWYQLFSSGIPYGSPTFGQAGDVPAPADFDGDGKTDIAIFRRSTGTWWYRPSTTNQIFAANLGHPADALPLPSDVDGDGRDDFVVYRPANNTWYWTTIVNFSSSQVFGVPGDIPVIADFDGDGKSDRAIFRPSNGDWWYLASASFGSLRNFHWGQIGDIPAPADYDGDGKTDFAVFRPSDGGWYIFRSSDLQVITTAFGLAGDRPVAADYDGDGRADIAVFRPSNGIWYLNQSTSGTGGLQWGLATDVAIPNAFTQQ